MSTNTDRTFRFWGWPTLCSIAVAALVLLWLMTRLDWQEIWRTIAASNKALILAAVIAHYTTFVLRGLRWRHCVAHLPGEARWPKLSLLLLFSYAVDNVLPAKLSDVYAAHLARINCGIRRSEAMGSIVFMRLLDAWVVLLLAAATSWFLFSSALPDSVQWTLILGVVLAFGASFILLLFAISRNALPSWIPERVRQMLQAFHTGMWPQPAQLIPIAIFTLSIWTLETLWTVCLVLAFGSPVSVVEGIFLTAIPVLASAFPLTPSGSGVVEVTLFSCFRIVGIPAGTAASLTVVNRLLDYWLQNVAGIAIWIIRRRLGLRTWRDVPIGTFRPDASPDTSTT